DDYSTIWDKLHVSYILDEPTEAGTGPAEHDFREHRLEDTERSAITSARRGQQIFRNAVLAAHDNQCCITGIRNKELLRASHIIPWSSSTRTRLDPCNGQCLTALHDAAFDRGIITLSPSLEVIVAKSIKKQMSAKIYDIYFGSCEGGAIRPPERHAPNENYIAYHRICVYNKI
ncbi:MAG: HNH endonuclease, partial [Planctomycetota bacterium]